MTARTVRNDAASATTIDLLMRRSLRHRGELPDPPAADREPPAAAAARSTLTVTEAADLLGVSAWLVRQQVSRGLLPSVRLGRRVLIPRTRLLAWLETEHESTSRSD